MDLYLVHDPALMYDEEHSWEWFWSEIESVKEQGLTRYVQVINWLIFLQS